MKAKVIAIAAVTAGGKTTIVNKLKSILPKATSLHFDDYDFEGAVDDYYQWAINGADYNVWNIEPLRDDVDEILQEEKLEYLLLDYPFAYCHNELKDIIDVAIFIDTPLDIALTRMILRDMSDATADDIREWLDVYLKYARVAYLEMLESIKPSSDYVVDGNESVEIIVRDIERIIKI